MTMDRESHPARAFFGRRKGHALRPRQAEIIEALLPGLAIGISRPSPVPIATLFPWTYLCASVGATLLTVGLTALGASHLKRSQGQDGPGIGIAQQSYCSKLIRAANLDRTSGLGSSSTEDLSE